MALKIVVVVGTWPVDDAGASRRGQMPDVASRSMVQVRLDMTGKRKSLKSGPGQSVVQVHSDGAKSLTRVCRSPMQVHVDMAAPTTSSSRR